MLIYRCIGLLWMIEGLYLTLMVHFILTFWAFRSETQKRHSLNYFLFYLFTFIIL